MHVESNCEETTSGSLLSSIEEQINPMIDVVIRDYSKIGFNPTEMIVDKITSFLEELHDKAKSDIDSYQQKIDVSVQKMQELSTSLRMPCPTADQFVGNMLEVLDTLQDNVSELKQEYDSRLQILQEFHVKYVCLQEQLGQPLHDDFLQIGNDFSQERIQQIVSLVGESEVLVKERTEEIYSLSMEILNLYKEMCMDMNTLTEFQSKIYNLEFQDLPPTTVNIASLVQEKDHLIQLKCVREEKIQGYDSQLKNLWNMLDISQDDRNVFFSRAKGLSTSTISIYEEELNKMQYLKKQSLMVLIEKAKDTIRELWSEMLYDEDTHSERYSAYYIEDNTEDTLNALTYLIDNLKQELEEVKPIISLINKRKYLTDKQTRLEERANNPKRLLEMKSSIALLKEERDRKRVNIELPKLNTKLIKLLSQWKTTHNEPLFINGFDYLEMLESERGELDRIKAEIEKKQKMERLARLGRTPIRKKTTSKRSITRSSRSAYDTPTKMRVSATPAPSKTRAALRHITNTANTPSARITKKKRSESRIHRFSLTGNP
eukprot:TRINITY_DN3304_c0_g1_i1.p1 TRINITY_DN3304_c0_g1~~TRINITY_DN3304_c0_g1_i1.p1  ORF type:complete len:546 (+),score=109.00 TRINITY_DN3304_c0_g1_i1:50-1687(+)